MRTLWPALLLMAACDELFSGDKDTDTGEPLNSIDQEILDAHNDVRSALGIAPLSWDTALVASSQQWGDTLADNDCAFEHEDQNAYGENLWWSNYEPTPTEVVQAWADEVAYYDYDTNTCDAGEMCGHYTQIVWADTTHVGCAKSTCDAGEVIWVCRYDPPGNWVGQKPY